jgi:hypothetical protein
MVGLFRIQLGAPRPSCFVGIREASTTRAWHSLGALNNEDKQLGRPKMAADIERAILADLRADQGCARSPPRTASPSTRCRASRTRGEIARADLTIGRPSPSRVRTKPSMGPI